MAFLPRIPEERRRQLAYHEAGHVVAYAFFWHDWSNLAYVTIKPNAECPGHAQMTGVRMIHYFASLQMRLKAPLAYVEAVCALAGPVAEAKYSQTGFDFAESAEERSSLKMGRLSRAKTRRKTIFIRSKR
jgi:hypothetical protein